MALKSTRRVVLENPTRYKTDAVVAQGSALVLKTSQPSGAGVGEATNDERIVAVNYSGAPASGSKFLGVALDEVISLDLSKYTRQTTKTTTRVIGETLNVGEIVEVWTNKVTGTPTPMTDAFLAADSTFGTVSVNSNPAVGKWMSSKDADGYALILIKVV